MALFYTTSSSYNLIVVREVLFSFTRNFIWAGDDSDTASGGHSLVNWKTVYRPTGAWLFFFFLFFGVLFAFVSGQVSPLDVSLCVRVGVCLCFLVCLMYARLQLKKKVLGGLGIADLECFRKGALRQRFPGLFVIATRKNRSVHDELRTEAWISGWTY
jgi:hypothetical protein